jgi:hypothetical protein
MCDAMSNVLVNVHNCSFKAVKDEIAISLLRVSRTLQSQCTVFTFSCLLQNRRPIAKKKRKQPKTINEDDEIESLNACIQAESSLRQTQIVKAYTDRARKCELGMDCTFRASHGSLQTTDVKCIVPCTPPQVKQSTQSSYKRN